MESMFVIHDFGDPYVLRRNFMAWHHTTLSYTISGIPEACVPEQEVTKLVTAMMEAQADHLNSSSCLEFAAENMEHLQALQDLNLVEQDRAPMAGNCIASAALPLTG